MGRESRQVYDWVMAASIREHYPVNQNYSTRNFSLNDYIPTKDKLKKILRNFTKYFSYAALSLSLALLPISPEQIENNRIKVQEEVVNTKKPVKVKIVSEDVEVYTVKPGDNLSTIVKNFYNIKGKTRDKTTKTSEYNALHNPDERVRNTIQADFLGHSDKIEGAIEDGIPGDDLRIGSKILLPYETEKSIDLIVDGRNYTQGNIEEKIEKELSNKGYKNFKIKSYEDFKNDEQNDVIVSTYNNFGIKKAREISKLDSDSLYSRLNEEANKGNTIKYSINLVNNRKDKMDFLKDTVNIYLSNTNKKAREIINNKYEYNIGSDSSLYRLVDQYAVLNKEDKIRKRNRSKAL